MNYIKAIDDNRNSLNRVNMAYLQKKHNAKLRTRLEIYEKILNRIYNRIDIASNVDNTTCVFDIPEYIYGFPIYNIKACAEYLSRKLISNGFHVKYIQPNILYIYWNYNSSINCISPLMNVPYTAEIAYPDSMEPKQTSLHVLPEPELPDYDKPAIKTIPLPPMNFEHGSNHEMLSLLPPPNRSPTSQSQSLTSTHFDNSNQWNRSTSGLRDNGFGGGASGLRDNGFGGGGSGSGGLRDNGFGGSFQISLSERPKPRQQKVYKSTEEYRPSGKFLYHK